MTFDVIALIVSLVSLGLAGASFCHARSIKRVDWSIQYNGSHAELKSQCNILLAEIPGVRLEYRGAMNARGILNSSMFKEGSNKINEIEKDLNAAKSQISALPQSLDGSSEKDIASTIQTVQSLSGTVDEAESQLAGIKAEIQRMREDRLARGPSRGA